MSQLLRTLSGLSAILFRPKISRAQRYAVSSAATRHGDSSKIKTVRLSKLSSIVVDCVLPTCLTCLSLPTYCITCFSCRWWSKATPVRRQCGNTWWRTRVPTGARHTPTSFTTCMWTRCGSYSEPALTCGRAIGNHWPKTNSEVAECTKRKQILWCQFKSSTLSQCISAFKLFVQFNLSDAFVVHIDGKKPPAKTRMKIKTIKYVPVICF